MTNLQKPEFNQYVVLNPTKKVRNYELDQAKDLYIMTGVVKTGFTVEQVQA